MTPTNMLTRPIYLSIAWSVLFVAIGLPGCSPPPAEEEAELPPLSPVPVEAVTIEPATLRPAIDLIATIVAIPERTAVISSQLGGWVEKIAAVEGQQVHQGDPLILLDAHAAKADMDRAEAMVAEKHAALARLKRGYLPQELEVARQDRDRARAAMEGLLGEVAALKELQARNEVSKVLLETKQKSLQQAEAALGSAEAHTRLLEQGTPPELIDEAQAMLDAAQAGLEHAKLSLQWCIVKSPISGVVVQHLARQGQFFDRAAPLATIMDLSEIFIQLRIPSAEFSKIRLGTPVDVQVTAEAGRTLRGTITRFSGDADPLTGNVIVFAAIKNEDGLLRPGMGCRARVWLPEIPDALAIPTAAIADHDGVAVVTVIRDGKAHEIEVELGARTPDLVQVVKGLSPGDMVATLGGYGLPDDCPVQIVANLGEHQSASP